ncbi:MAG: hypothetical protein NUV84_04570 [Candidatus Uhrbacteria bacterium]|nr:hypothetical protein [Candidatus Uhrbacteria bacterium]
MGLVVVAPGEPLRHDATVADQHQCVAGAASSVDPKEPHERLAGAEDRPSFTLLGESVPTREHPGSPQAAGDVGAIDRTHQEGIEAQFVAGFELASDRVPVVGRHRGEADQDVISVAGDELAHVDAAAILGLDTRGRLTPDPEGGIWREVEQAGARLEGWERVHTSTRAGGGGGGRFGHEVDSPVLGSWERACASWSWSENTHASLLRRQNSVNDSCG